MTLNGRNTLFPKKSFYGAHSKNLNEDGPKLSAAKCRSIILVTRNVRLVRIFAGVPCIGAPNDSVVLEILNVQTFPLKFPNLKSTLLYSNT